MNYGVTFPMFSKIDVNGDDAHPLFKYLTSTKKGLLGSEGIKWNFTKFLIGKDGSVARALRADHEAGGSGEGCRAGVGHVNCSGRTAGLLGSQVQSATDNRNDLCGWNRIEWIGVGWH